MTYHVELSLEQLKVSRERDIWASHTTSTLKPSYNLAIMVKEAWLSYRTGSMLEGRMSISLT